jgi:SAM-dependent methyltransferase
MSADPTSSRDELSDWQLRMFDKSLKKRQKVAMLLRMLGPLQGSRCLLVTNGDNNGAMNWHFRAAGGEWTFADMELHGINEMSVFLGAPVHKATPDRIPVPDAAFDKVVVIDVHEHFPNLDAVNREIARVTKPGGMAIITTPNGDTRLPVAKFKNWLGMTPASYGHVVQGYRARELEAMLRSVGLVPRAQGAYSRFFTEFAELVINFAYVKILSRKKGGPVVPKGTIAPTTSDQLRAVRKAYQAYRVIYPLMRVFSALDVLIPLRGGYAVAVAADKPASG